METPVAPPKLAAAIQITMTTTGQVSCQTQADDPMAVFMALGSAIQQLAMEFKKKRDMSIEVATPNTLARLPN